VLFPTCLGPKRKKLFLPKGRLGILEIMILFYRVKFTCQDIFVDNFAKGQEQTYVDISSFSYKTHFRLTIQRYGCIYLFMKWQVIFYRNISGQCPTEKFINGLPYDDAEEIVAAIAALRELGNKARRPLADYLEDGIYELRARRLQRRFRVLYTFVGKEAILLLTGFVKKSKAVPAKTLRKAKTLKRDYLERMKGDNNG